MDSITGFLMKSKVTSEVKNITRELGLESDSNNGADEERKKREAEDAYRKQEIKTEEKMRQIEAGIFILVTGYTVGILAY